MANISSPKTVSPTTTQRRPPPNKAKVASLVDQVYKHLRIAIIEGEIPQGQKLVELDIAADMGTSQGPVREALQRLEYDGLVERRARSATFVTKVSPDEMYELFYIRSVIESFAINHTVKNVTTEQCDELEILVENMALAGANLDINRLAEFDMTFHRLICEWSGSLALLRAWSPLSSQIQRFVVQSHPERYPDLKEVGTRHQKIVDVLRQRDSANAAEVLRKHIMLIWDSTSSQ